MHASVQLSVSTLRIPCLGNGVTHSGWVFLLNEPYQDNTLQALLPDSPFAQVDKTNPHTRALQGTAKGPQAQGYTCLSSVM